jgi:tRNA pseudouridine38-40 synthase
MVGTLLEVGRGRLKPEDIDRLYEIKDRAKAGPTVPSQGLVMVEVQHEEAWRIGDP